MMCAIALCATAWTVPVTAQNLWVDFNSTTQDGGPTNQDGYQPYNAGHEVSEDFVAQSYAAFGTNVSLTPDWPDTTDNRVEQMIDRAPGNDANWQGAKLNLLTDFIGIDTRTASGGNGDYDGVTGSPTRMTFTLSGVPAGDYTWRSYHHDTENIHTPFTVAYSVDGGATFATVGEFKGTNSSPNSNPPAPEIFSGAGGMDPAMLSSTVNFGLSATGSDRVLQFTPLAGTAVHTQILAVNGFELSVVPEPSSLLLTLSALLGMLGLRRRS
jgi:hypothetical protein